MKWINELGSNILRRLNYGTPSFIRALMVDDDANDVLLAQNCVRRAKERGLCTAEIEIEHAQSYEDGLREVERGNHDVYLVDWKLITFGDGMKLIEECTDKGKCGPFIILTGISEEALRQDARRMLESGIMAFVPKQLMSFGNGFALIIQTTVRDYRLIRSLVEERGKA